MTCIILILWLQILPQHSLDQVLVRWWQLKCCHHTYEKPYGHQVEGQGGEDGVKQEPEQVDHHPPLAAHRQEEQGV